MKKGEITKPNVTMVLSQYTRAAYVHKERKGHPRIA